MPKKLDAKTEKALSVFVEYFSSDEPYNDMKKVDYRSLGKYFEMLPKSLFLSPKYIKGDKYHARSETNISKSYTLTESGIISIASLDGVESFTGGGADVWAMRVDVKEVDKVLKANKLLKYAYKKGIRVSNDIFERSISEDEHVIIPTKSMREKFNKYAKNGNGLQTRVKLYA